MHPPRHPARLPYGCSRVVAVIINHKRKGAKRSPDSCEPFWQIIEPEEGAVGSPDLQPGDEEYRGHPGVGDWELKGAQARGMEPFPRGACANAGCLAPPN